MKHFPTRLNRCLKALSYEGRGRGFVLREVGAGVADNVELEVLVFDAVLDGVSVRRARSSIALKDWL